MASPSFSTTEACCRVTAEKNLLVAATLAKSQHSRFHFRLPFGFLSAATTASAFERANHHPLYHATATATAWHLHAKP
jgi:hypothetical protein